MKWALDHPARYRFMFENTEPGAMLSASDQALALASLRALETVIKEGVRQGEITTKTPDATALVLLAVLHGLCSLALSQRLESTAGHDVIAFLRAHQDGWLNAILNI